MAPALSGLLSAASYNHASIDLNAAEFSCNGCHKASTAGGIAPVFSKIHSGYNEVIYDTANGNEKYSDNIVVTVDTADAVYDATASTVTFTATVTANDPYDVNAVDLAGAYGGLYGYDTKDLISSRIYGTTAATGFVTSVDANTNKWAVTIDYTTDTATDAVANLTSGAATRAQLVVLPKYTNAAGAQVALNAAVGVLDLASGDAVAEPQVADVNKCNACHEALGTTFHSPDRGGSIETCKACHAVTSPGSHLEMQSRSLDSYVHAIHSFQAFDINNIDFTDPVAKTEYELHISHVFPNFTIMNCESCHFPGTFNAPSYADSLPGELSGAELNADLTANGFARNIGDVPARLVDPATRTCGACHRAQAIKADNPAAIQALYEHNATNGYGQDGGVFADLVAYIYAWFK
jgi:OmcA/MtrC family decaheme c-type cytochrome